MKKWQKGVLKSSNRKFESNVEPNFRKRNVGRPNCLEGERLRQLLDAYYSHPYSLRELADMFGVSRMTVWRAVNMVVS